MLGIFLIYYIGNSFYKLAAEFNKHKWAFAILGVVTYYGSGFLVLTIGIAILTFLNSFPSFDAVPAFAWDLLAIPIGIGSCYGLHSYLKFQWTRAPKAPSAEVLDADLMK